MQGNKPWPCENSMCLSTRISCQCDSRKNRVCLALQWDLSGLFYWSNVQQNLIPWVTAYCHPTLLSFSFGIWADGAWCPALRQAVNQGLPICPGFNLKNEVLFTCIYPLRLCLHLYSKNHDWWMINNYMRDESCLFSGSTYFSKAMDQCEHRTSILAQGPVCGTCAKSQSSPDLTESQSSPDLIVSCCPRMVKFRTGTVLNNHRIFRSISDYIEIHWIHGYSV